MYFASQVALAKGKIFSVVQANSGSPYNKQGAEMSHITTQIGPREPTSAALIKKTSAALISLKLLSTTYHGGTRTVPPGEVSDSVS